MPATSHEEMMRLALSLAEKGRAGVQPNPMVGALIVNGGEVVGEGFHERVGQEHAEVRAIAAAGEKARGGILYSNLEPCDHYGRTPPCTQAIARAGIARVVCADRDPNPVVDGKGIAALERSGIPVEVGVLQEQARRLNEIYYTFITTKRPFVSLKLAQSLDGRIVFSSVTKWLTGSPARRRAHELRACHASIMVGIGTVRVDDPLLTVRSGEYAPLSKQPLRVILDSKLELPPDAKLVKTAGEIPTLVYAGAGAGDERPQRIARRGVEVQAAPQGPDGRLDLSWILSDLGKRGISSLLVEGGRELASSFLVRGLVHKVFLFMAPCILGEGEGTKGLAAPKEQCPSPYWLQDVTLEKIGSDLLVSGYPSPSGD